MPVSIGKKPDSDFSDPLGMLSDCHRRIERFLNVLTSVAERAAGGELDDEQREGLDAAVRYFRTSGPTHTDDEEVSLFPRMRTKRVDAAILQLESLHRDHVEADKMHRVADELGQRWLSEGSLPDEDARKLSAAVRELHRIYAAHIACEDREVFPLAARILDEADIREIGQEMASRRRLS